MYSRDSQHSEYARYIDRVLNIAWDLNMSEF